MLGIGMMASVPQASIMLLLIGWFTSPPKTEVVEDEAFLATAKQFRVA